ncbi:hypothetical protein [Nocardioides sp. SR21]|uniref:hypothetical protein n=1 Tax=Nocardioides sp. SR21 TaxID=2919501 RepID=UPI001FA97535|nr:hypothetical protein [Nocardioides sp. SR21]
MSRRTIFVALGVLVLLLALLPFVPRGGGGDDALRPSGDEGYAAARPAGAAGASVVTAEARAEIERVVAAGTRLQRSLSRTSGKASPEQLAASLVRCAEFEGQRYCLGSGWTEDTEDDVQARAARSARTVAARPAGAVEQTGDLDAAAALAQRARMSPQAMARADRAELTMAARSIAKVWLLRHEIEGVPLPADFLADHPEARVAVPSTSAAKPTSKPTASATASPSTTSSAVTVKTAADYPQRFQILSGVQSTAQIRTYWCGPTSMQMIAWGWRKEAQPQQHWAKRLGTTTSGTSIYDMVRVVNRATGWDNAKHAGPYIVLDIGKYSYAKWMLLMMRHIHDYRAPVVLHPILLKRYYPYLDDDASGHFQVGRGFAQRGAKTDKLGYFEPWNQQRFDPSEPYIARVQWRDAYRSFRANQAHYAHNVGV